MDGFTRLAGGGGNSVGVEAVSIIVQCRFIHRSGP